MTSMPPFLAETLSWPLMRGRVARRSSQTWDLLPKRPVVAGVALVVAAGGGGEGLGLELRGLERDGEEGDG